MLSIERENSAFLRLDTDDLAIIRHISDEFVFELPNYKFTKTYKLGNKRWNGQIKLLKKNKFLYSGLIHILEKFLKENNYSFVNNFHQNSLEITREEVKQHIASLKLEQLEKPIEVRDYQEESAYKLLNEKNSILISPTSCMDEQTEISVKLSKQAFDFIKNFSKKINFFYAPTVKITLKELEILVVNKFVPQINTPTGFRNITQTYRKTAVGKLLTFTDLSYLKCAEKHLIFVDDAWTYARDLTVGQKINDKIVHSISNVDQQQWVDFTVDDHHHCYYHNGMLHHNSGKSLIMFFVITYLLKHKLAKKFLITVPKTSLVDQLATDFISYCSYPKIKTFFQTQVHKIMEGREKESHLPLIISTFQSAVRIPNLDSYDFVASDEVHGMSKDSGQFIYEQAINTSYRMGFTGTLQDTLLDVVILEGLIGKPFQLVTTSELMTNGQVADLLIEIIVLKYSEKISKFISGLTYQEEVEFIISNEMRMKIITDFVLSLEQNSLVLFTRIEKHGDQILKCLQEKNKNKIIIYLTGDNSVEEREAARKTAEENDNVIIVASYGIFAEGISIKNIHNIIFASGYKARIKVLQSIGRGLRLHENKEVCKLYDFVDNAKYKNKNNYLLDHFLQRFELYKSEKFLTNIINHPQEI